VIAYVDRANVAFAKFSMAQHNPAFTNDVIGFGAGVFFLGYFLLEIPGTLLVERWSARRWIARIMITWGIVAALTATVKTPTHFYVARFGLGLAEAGFFPGIIVYLTHWFPSRDRARALAYFLLGTPVAQFVSPKICGLMMEIGKDAQHPAVLGMYGWQWIFIVWGIPAVVLGGLVLVFLTDRPRQAKWLAPDERDALEAELERERALSRGSRHMTVREALAHPKVLLLAAAYFGVVTANYGIEFFMPSILKAWYKLGDSQLTTLAMLPAVLTPLAQLFIGWSSDRMGERRLHASLPIILGAFGLAAAVATKGTLWLTVACFMLAGIGVKGYLPAFWSLPSLFLTEAAAAGSIGLINSVGNLGGFLGPSVVGKVETVTGSFVIGVYFLAASMTAAAIVILMLGLGRRAPPS
jgi:ACS family tartrate transporter-like MFS transporter